MQQLVRSARLGGLAALALVVALGSAGVAADPPAAATVKPVPRDDKWKQRHDKFVEIAKRGGVDVLFVGDSITDAWGGEGHGGGAGAKLFKETFEPMKAANFGIGGDRTQHVLWRLQNGELDGIQPKVLMLMIGTNNMGSDKAEEIADGVKAIVEEVKKRSPKTKILLLGIFPRGEKPGMQRDKIKAANDIIKKMDDGGKTVKYLDIGDKFVEKDGTISKEVMPDFLHLSGKGYQIWADAVTGEIKALMK